MLKPNSAYAYAVPRGGGRGLCSADHAEAVKCQSLPRLQEKHGQARPQFSAAQYLPFPHTTDTLSYVMTLGHQAAHNISHYIRLSPCSLESRIELKNVVWPERWCTSNTPAEMEQFFFGKPAGGPCHVICIHELELNRCVLVPMLPQIAHRKPYNQAAKLPNGIYLTRI